MSQWHTILNRSELEAFHALTASIDPRYAKEERAFYQRRSQAQLRVISDQAWLSCEPTSYQLARSYAALQR